MSTEESTTDNEEVTEEGTPETTDKGQVKAGREAAKYRKQLRAVEAERDTLLSTIESLQRGIIESELAGKMEVPRSFWLGESKPADFFNEDGSLDQLAVKNEATRVTKEFGLRSSYSSRFHGSGGNGVRHSEGTRAATWQQAIQQR